MSEIKNKDRILEAIDQLRRRKARPDIDRICNFLLRRFSVNNKETVADLARMVEAEIVIKVEYKGNTSDRNAAKWTRLSVYKSKESNNTENINVSEARIALNRAFASLLVNDPDYLDFGVPEKELKRFLSEESSINDLAGLDAVLQREINSGFLVKLANGNFSLADHPVPSRKISGGSISSDVKVLKFESPSSQFQTEPVNTVQNSTKRVSDNSAEDPIKGQNVVGEGGKDVNAGDSTATGAINVGGFRVGVRRKRAKKVFDPSDNNIPIRKRSRSSPNKKETQNVATNLEPTDSSLGPQGNNRRGQSEKAFSGQSSENKSNANSSGTVDLHGAGCRCVSCRICALCLRPVYSAPKVTCTVCNEMYHRSCHPTEITTELSTNGEWQCYRCVPPNKPKLNIQDDDSTNTVVDSGHVLSPSTAPSVPDFIFPCFPIECDCQLSGMIDNSIPDVRGWSEKEIFMYFEELGFSEQAETFLQYGIDGDSVLVLSRQDVLNTMGMRLGPALKIYRQVQKLQLRRSEPHLFWV